MWEVRRGGGWEPFIPDLKSFWLNGELYPCLDYTPKHRIGSWGPVGLLDRISALLFFIIVSLLLLVQCIFNPRAIQISYTFGPLFTMLIQHQIYINHKNINRNCWSHPLWCTSPPSAGSVTGKAGKWGSLLNGSQLTTDWLCLWLDILILQHGCVLD